MKSNPPDRPTSVMHFDVFGSEDFLKRFRRHAPRRRLIALKYPDLPDLQYASDVIAYAEKIAPRIRIAPACLDALYSRSIAAMERDAWEQAVRVAFCIDHVTTDVRPQERSPRIVSAAPQPGAKLFLTFHGGFFQLTLHWLSCVMPNLIVASRAADPAAKLFELHRGLQDGRAVLIAPDAQVGTLKSSIRVLGREHRVAEGAAFMAFQTRCPVAWCMVERHGDQFTPMVRPMPHVEGDYAVFKDHFFKFYADNIETILTGEPHNLSIKPPWTAALSTVRPNTAGP